MLACNHCNTAVRCNHTGDLFETNDYTSPDMDRTSGEFVEDTDRAESDSAIISASGNASHLLAIADTFATPRQIAEFEDYRASGNTGDLPSTLRASVWRTARVNGQCLIWTCHTVIAAGTRYVHSPSGFGYCAHCASGTGVPVDTFATAGACEDIHGRTIPGYGIWYARNDSGFENTYWYFDGTNAWYCSRENNFRLCGSEFTPESLARCETSRYFRIVSDPRIAPAVQIPIDNSLSYDIAF
jgi:hypothetical protein